MSTALELAHTLIRDGVYEAYHADLETIRLSSSDGRGASVTPFKGGFTVARNHGPRPRILYGSFQEVLEHLSIG